MPLLTATNLQHAYGSQAVLAGASLTVEPGEKIGLVGRNGTGKTTFMKALLGELRPDQGTIQLQRGARVGYVSQDPRFDPDETVRDAAEGAFEELHRLHQELHAVFDQMATAEGEALERLMKRQTRLEAGIEAAGGYAIDHRIDATLHGLGLSDREFALKTASLSGGQKGRLGLARVLLDQPDLLLLDEPTNHLDIAGREWLEAFLAEEYPGAVLLVSHDRWLLERVVGRIVEVEDGVLLDYPGSFSKYVALREERKLAQARVHEKQLGHVRREQQFIRRYKAGQRAKQARGRESRLDRFRESMVERPAELEVMRLQLPKAPRSGELVMEGEGLSKSYDGHVLFDDLDLTLMRGERVGVIGPNGTGKTTLVRCLLGEAASDAGRVRLGSRLSVGYYRQLHDDLDRSLSVWQYLQSVIVSLDGAARASEQQARDLAGAFLFSGIEQDKALADLSGGERSRAVLAGLVAGAHNLLVLDEPSNHLDIPAAERLEAALLPEQGYDGTLLLITHDRALLQSTCTSLIIFEGDGRVRRFDGRYSEWLDRQAQEKAESRQAETPRPVPRAAPKSKSRPKGQPAAPRAQADALARLSLDKLEARIERIECEIADVDAALLDPKAYSDGPRCKALQERRAELVRELQPIELEWSRRGDDEES